MNMQAKRAHVPIGKTGYFLSSSARGRLGKIKRVDERRLLDDMQSERELISRMDSAIHPEERPEMKGAYVKYNAKLTAERMRQMADMGEASNEEIAHAINVYHRMAGSFGSEYGEIFLKELRKIRLIARPMKLKK